SWRRPARALMLRCLRHDERRHKGARLVSLGKTALAVLPAPAEQQRGRYVMTPCRRRSLAVPRQALLDDARLLRRTPTPTPTGVHHRQLPDKDTIAIHSHSDSEQPSHQAVSTEIRGTH